ncbi:TetR/AcrR family transcriptional regulator [Rhodococcus sp. P1Y]|uniref:TetR/AcrR family transcriptional regulator n=1 Tax=Rhodococcus sp. P1Y TaxID=1302308 RepID=UPI000EAEDE27|nr:TetR/AcrR family transcriptional regulator [Rhodococcus sp. P1Y]AYJ50333.1 TetR/AcrR family transcriptional regulator [Rhodococcus sp. P1Y]
MARNVVTGPAPKTNTASAKVGVSKKTAGSKRTAGAKNPTGSTRAAGSTKSAASANGDASTPTKQSPREARRQQRIELSREQILDTAEELFAERGYHETGLKDVAAKCEFSVGSIYTFFDSKDVLYEQVLMRRCIDTETLHRMLPDTMPADERLVELARTWIQHAVEYPAWGALTAEITRLSRSPGAVFPEAWYHQTQERQRFLVDLIKKGQTDGILRHGSPTSLARLFHAVVTSFIVVSTMVRMNGTGEPDDAEEFLGFVQDTFSTRPTTNPFHEDLDD